jgi:hypothetical protein
MAELRYALDPMPAAEQLAFVEASLRTSFRITGFSAAGGEARIGHPDDESGEAIRAMVKRFLFISKNIHKDLVFHNDVPIAYTADPQPELERTREVMPIQPGFFSLQGDFLRVFQAVNAASRRLAMEVQAIEQEHPAVWPVRLFKMIDYFHEFPQQMILCAPVKDDFATRSLFSKLFRKDQGFETVPMNEHMADAAYGLQPAVCDCCYYVLEGSRSHADAFYTTVNKVFRNERSSSNRLDRLTNFTVRDIMFVGSEGFVLEARQRLIEMLQRFLAGLHINAKIETANDPFFANDSAMKTVFQNAHRLKYELLARIPHLDREIAVGSINLHTDFFGKAFDIKMADGATAHSGCIGVGMERMTYALFCQHGPKLAAWPRGLLEFLELAA